MGAAGRRGRGALDRDPDTIERGLFYAPTGDGKLEALAGQGVSRAVLPLPQGSRDEVLAALDEFTPVVDRLADA
jgi:hypothetical protein